MSRAITLTSPSGVTLKTKNKYMDDDVAVQVGDAENIIASNIKSGVTILGVSGTLLEPSGTLSINSNGVYDVGSYASANVSIPIPSGTLEISSNGVYDVGSYASANVNVPMPSGTIEISANGVYDVGSYASASVNVPQISTEPTIDGLCNNLYSEITLNASSMVSPLFYTNSFVEKVTFTNGTSVLADCFYSATALKFFSGSKVETILESAFYGCSSLTSFYLPTLKNVGRYAFRQCSNIAFTDFNYSLFETVDAYAFENTKTISASFLEFPRMSIIDGYMLADVPHTQSFFLSYSSAYAVMQGFHLGYAQYSQLFEGVYAPKVETVNGNLFSIPTITLASFTSIAYIAGAIATYASFSTLYLGGGTQIICGQQYLLFNTSVKSLYFNSIVPTTISNANVEAILKSSYVSSIYVPKQCLEEYKTATNWVQRANDFIPYDFGKPIEAIGKDIASGTSLSLSINCSTGDNLILCVTYRATSITVPDWTLIYESDNYYNGGTQKQAVFVRTASSSVESASVTVNTSGRVYACICNIKNKTASINTSMCLIQFGDLPTVKHINKETDNDVLFFVGNVFYEALNQAYDRAFDAYHGCGISGEFEQICAFGRDYRAVMYYSKVPKNDLAMLLDPARPVTYGHLTMTYPPGNFGITAIELSEPEE